MYTYVYLNHYDVEQKLTQHCKSTILQFEKDSFHLMLMMLKWIRKENQSYLAMLWYLMKGIKGF